MSASQADTNIALDFSAALRRADASAPFGVVGPDRKPSTKRFNVYRNNVSASLIEALGDNFPVVKMLVGDEFFDAMAQVFHRANYPKEPMLFRYGAAFPGFLEHFEPVKDVPYLPDVARLEWAWLQAFHAADVEALDGAVLARFDPQILHEVTFHAHPAAAIVSSRWPVASIVSSHRQGGDLSGIDMGSAEQALVARRDVVVEIRTLPPGGSVFLEALIAGEPLGVAAQKASGDAPEFDLASNIAGMLEAAVFAGAKHPAA
ncbi:MAG: DNA-binding domain-containing protein [Ahrensia sp.]|nr:DNA-binding domain-containing protein [Ahrensia sp.]